MTSVAIIGAGIVGATLGQVLAREGARVTLIDGGGDLASDGSLAWLNASSTTDPTYGAIRAESVRMWQRLAVDPTCPVTFSGSLMWGASPDGAQAQAQRMASIGWRSLVVTKPEIEAMVDGINAPDVALMSPDEGYADPVAITKWMRQQALAAGATMERRWIASVDAVNADHIVVCAGNGSVDLLPDLPLTRSPGIVMRTAVLPRYVPGVLATPKLDFWQGADGRVVMSSSLSKTPDRADDLLNQDALDALRGIFPDFDTTVTATIRRDRPIPMDGFPLVGRFGKVWVAAMHSGMTLAPVMAEALADQILARAQRYDISPYAPDRPLGAQEKAAL